MFKYYFSFILFTIINQFAAAQGILTGNIRLNFDLYDRDPAIAAVGPNYDYNKSSANAWLQTMYINNDLGFEGGIRFDGNYNSILQAPPIPVSFYGIGNWYLKKKIDKLEVMGGYIYEQYGMGVALRTFEERSLGIDNAIYGIKAKYSVNDHFFVRGIAGTQKNRLGDFGAFVKGINADYSHDFNDSMGINFGASIVNRTMTENDRDAIDKEVAGYTNANYFATNYNTSVLDLYTTVRYKNLSLNLEGAYKTKGAIYNPLIKNANYQNKEGYMIYGSLTYVRPKLGVTLQARQMENFQFQSTMAGSTDFNLNNNRRISFFAPLNKQHSLRLPARFQIAPQELGEVGSSLDLTYSLTKHVALNLNLAMIDTIGWKDPYYREAYADIGFKKLMSGKLDMHYGLQYIYYNQQRYLGGNEPTDVTAITAFTEGVYRISRKRSMRAEVMLQSAPKELGSSVFLLLEYNIAPSWSFSVSDLYNFKPNPHYEVVKEYQNSHHFWSVFASYTKNTTRFTLMYTKQLAGIVCTGGVCRFEPAFSGLRAQMTATF